MLFSHVNVCFYLHNMQKSAMQIIYLGELPTWYLLIHV